MASATPQPPSTLIYIVAIVAVVAILAMVVFSSLPSNNLAGNAIPLKKQVNPGVTSDMPEYNENLVGDALAKPKRKVYTG
jgi:hypothetical protein